MNPHLSRRTVLGAAAAAALTTAVRVPTAVAGPQVDMQALLLAAQWDPARSDSLVTPGCATSVSLVERALADAGLLAEGLVDGHFGTATRAAYRSWQQRQGLSDAQATGLPDPVTLDALGRGRFAVVRPVVVGARVEHRGYPVNARTRAMLRAAEQRLGYAIPLAQGSYSPGVDPTSAGTHDRGGAVDLEARHLDPKARLDVARALREVGFAAWVRSPTQGDWPWHVHAIALSDTDLSLPALRQAGAYLTGRNGLRDNGPDDGPRVPTLTFENYLKGPNR